MARYTPRWGLSILGPGDALNADGYKALDADRRLIDRLLTVGAENHRHTGEEGADRTPTGPLNLTLQLTGGAMAAGERYYYKYTVIDDTGNESAPSPQQYVDTPPAVATPNASALTAITGTGALLPGTYSYVLSAYKGANTLETKAENSAVVTIYGVSAGSVSMILPDLPLTADGLNVYRKSQSGLHYLYITSIAAPTSGQIWVDDGSIEGTCDRSLPTLNRTSNANAVLVAYPGATPTIPDGWSWRIYRTTNPSDWASSYLYDVVPQGATPTTPVSWLDVGGGTQTGAPPVLSQVLNSPPKIRLTDAAEVAGYLPPGLAVVPYTVTFVQPGPVTVGLSTFVWTCDFDLAHVEVARAFLTPGSTPDTADVIVDVLVGRAATSTWDSIFDPGDRPTIAVGGEVGDQAVPLPTTLAVGDRLRVEVIQDGGGTPQTDLNLSVNVLLLARSGSTTTTYPWLTP